MNKKIITAGLCLCLSGHALASVYYLHADMPLGSSPLDNTLWFTDPVGGVDKATDGGTFGGNRFDLNGKNLRTQSLPGIGNFSGTIVVDTAGAGLADLLAGTWNLTGLDVDNAFQLRLRRATVNLNIADLMLGSSGVLKFRTLTGSNNLNFSATASSGDGMLEFGDPTYANDTNGVWSLDMSSTVFSGTISLVRGVLSIGNTCTLGKAALSIHSGENNRVELSGNSIFGTMNYGETDVVAGTHSASELNSLLGTTRFFGAGTVVVSTSTVMSVHAMFHDHMMLQRDLEVPVWGKGVPGAVIDVLLDGNPAGSTVVDENGRWMVRLAPHENDGGVPHALEVVASNAATVVCQDVIFGDIYLATGQSNMEREMASVIGFAEDEAAAFNPHIRQLKITRAKSAGLLYKPAITHPWESVTPATVGRFTAVGYFFAKNLYAETGVPVGLLNASYGGQAIHLFMNPEGMERVPGLSGMLTNRELGGEPTLGNIYNAMISPLVPYGICGFLWYQGEADRYVPMVYGQKMQALIRGFRAVWGYGDLPFYYVQLPNYDSPGYTYIRDAQLEVLSETNTGMAVLIDVGNDSDIHPTNKQDPGSRLAQWALARQFGRNIVYSGPVFESILLEGEQIRVVFDYAEGGLMVGQKVSTNQVVEFVGGELQNFEIAGSNRAFTAATAVIDSDSVVVFALSVSEPLYVRYCYADAPAGSNKLYNSTGLPAAAFRSDESPELVVVSGSGSLTSAIPGTVYSIAADTPPAGRVFDRWIGNAGSVADLNSSTTTITMPSQGVYLLATYRDTAASTYLLSVMDGAGDGMAQLGARLNVEADPAPTGMVFNTWIGDADELADASAPSTTLRMPAANVTVTATYRAQDPAPDAAVTGFLAIDDLARVRFPSEQGYRYAFDRSTNLVSGFWMPAIYNIKGDGFEKTLSAALGEQTMGYFRLRVK